jgi:uridine kinase
MRRSELIAELTDAILARKQTARPLRVAIDGRCAAGKTMLADELAAQISRSRPEIQVLRPSVDGFHHLRARRYTKGEFSAQGYYDDAYDYGAIVELLLKPLSGDTFPAQCRQVSADVRRDMPIDAPPVLVDANAVLLFEGIFVLRDAINAYWDLRILVDVNAEVSLARAVERDAGESGPRDVIEKKYRLRYEPAWQIYVERERPATKANMIVRNGDLQNPTLTLRRHV